MKQLTLIILLTANLFVHAQDSTSAHQSDYPFDTTALFNGQFVAIHNIHFQYDKAILDSTSLGKLDTLVDFLQNNPNIIIEVSYHRDCRGSAYCCYNLTQKRAEAIVSYLISKGISASRLAAKGYGENKPYILNGQTLTCEYIQSIDSNEKQEELHAQNRRAEIIILSYDYIPPEPKKKLTSPFNLK